MKPTLRVRRAARRILDGDESLEAANALEGALLDDHGDEDSIEELLYVLAMYRPWEGLPYSDAVELRSVVAAALDEQGPNSL